MSQDINDSPTSVSGNLIIVVSMLLFAVGFPAAEVLLETWQPISLITLRLILAIALMFPVWIFLSGWQVVRHAPWWRGLWIGGIGFGTGTVMLLVMQSMTDPVTAALAAATMPVSAVALEVMFDGRKLRWNFVLGVVLVLLGGILATGVNLTDATYGTGALLGVVAAMIFAWGSRKAVKGLPELDSFGQATLTLIGAMLVGIALYLLCRVMGWSGTASAPLGVKGWTMLLLYAWGAMAISQALWILGVGKLGVGIASFHLNATPFYVMVILLFMGGSWSWAQAFGAAVLACGVIVSQKRKRNIETPELIRG